MSRCTNFQLVFGILKISILKHRTFTNVNKIKKVWVSRLHLQNLLNRYANPEFHACDLYSLFLIFRIWFRDSFSMGRASVSMYVIYKGVVWKLWQNLCGCCNGLTMFCYVIQILSCGTKGNLGLSTLQPWILNNRYNRPPSGKADFQFSAKYNAVWQVERDLVNSVSRLFFNASITTTQKFRHVQRIVLPTNSRSWGLLLASVSYIWPPTTSQWEEPRDKLLGSEFLWTVLHIGVLSKCQLCCL